MVATTDSPKEGVSTDNGLTYPIQGWQEVLVNGFVCTVWRHNRCRLRCRRAIIFAEVQGCLGRHITQILPDISPHLRCFLCSILTRPE